MFCLGARLGALIRSELSALIVAKATRRKEVKVAPKNKAAEAEPGIKGIERTALHDSTGQYNEHDDEDAQKSRQAQINLMGVDTKRVSDFATFWYLFPETVIRLIFSIWFLVTLIGWSAVLAGLAVFILVLPLNVYASKAYSKTQGDLMKLRDQKMVL